MTKLVTYTAEEARNWKPSPKEVEIIECWQEQADENIDYSEIPELDDEFFKNGELPPLTPEEYRRGFLTS